VKIVWPKKRWVNWGINYNPKPLKICWCVYSLSGGGGLSIFSFSIGASSFISLFVSSCLSSILSFTYPSCCCFCFIDLGFLLRLITISSSSLELSCSITIFGFFFFLGFFLIIVGASSSLELSSLTIFF